MKLLVILTSAVLLLLTVALCSYIYFTPHLTVKAIHEAALSNDTRALEEQVDFPKVKADLKRQIMARIDDGARQSSNPFAALGSALAGALADPAIDALVTSENVARLLSGEEFGRAGRSGVEFDDDSLTMGYDGLNRFVVTTNAENGFTLVLERDGALTWKLTQVLLPASFSLPSMAPAATATTGPR